MKENIENKIKEVNGVVNKYTMELRELFHTNKISIHHFISKEQVEGLVQRLIEGSDLTQEQIDVINKKQEYGIKDKLAKKIVNHYYERIGE